MFLRLNTSLASLKIDANAIGLSGYQAIHTTLKRGLNKSLFFFDFPWRDYIRLNSTVDSQSVIGIHKKLRPVKQKQLQEVLLEIQLQIAKNRPASSKEIPRRFRKKVKPIYNTPYPLANISQGEIIFFIYYFFIFLFIINFLFINFFY